MTISEVTRRNIFDIFAQQKISWCGDLGEMDFLARLYDLTTIPSTDRHFPNASDDIRKHRILSRDWDDDWIFYDERFGFQDGDEGLLLRFLCETIHPIVRPNPDQARYLLQQYNLLLAPDGYEIFEQSQISGRPIFSYRTITATKFQSIEQHDISQLSGENSEPLLRTLARIFARESAAIEVAILANSKPYIKEVNDSLNVEQLKTDQSSISYALYLPIPSYLYNQVKQYIEEIEIRILEKIKLLLRTSSSQISRVIIALALSDEQQNWQERAKSWLSGKTPVNQGLLNPNNLLSHDGLFFRSQPSIFLYEALKYMKVSFTCLPLFIQGIGMNQAQQIQLDFLIIKEGIMLGIKVKDNTSIKETPTDYNWLINERVHFQAVEESECDNLQKAKLCVNKLMRIVETLKTNKNNDNV
ncbi:MAG TPA: hypothetical protein DCF68_10640 [Cyanothece sp. UBA12306]|nr:hypothetical protein [Cyanothece sp. UBA12306]